MRLGVVPYKSVGIKTDWSKHFGVNVKRTLVKGKNSYKTMVMVGLKTTEIKSKTIHFTHVHVPVPDDD